MSLKILGVSGSMRRIGNTEILLLEALKGARDQGAEVKAINLYDYKISSCRGCLNCLMYSKCNINDEFEKLMETFCQYDGIIVGSPNYANNIPAVFKLLNDRIFLINAKYSERLRNIRTAVFINYFCTTFQHALPLSLLVFHFAAMKLKVIDSQLFQASSFPSGVVKMEPQLNQAYEMGKSFAEKVRNQFEMPREYIDKCPDCYTTFFVYKDNDVVECPVCSRTGKVIDGHAVFKEEYNDVSYLSSNWIEFHMHEVMQSLEFDRIKNTSTLRKKYKKLMDEIKLTDTGEK